MEVNAQRMSVGTCSRCGKEPAYKVVLKLCDSCFKGLCDIPAPKDEHNAPEMNAYAHARREYLNTRL